MNKFEAIREISKVLSKEQDLARVGDKKLTYRIDGTETIEYLIRHKGEVVLSTTNRYDAYDRYSEL